MSLARQGGGSAHAVLALAGYLKLVGLPSQRPAAETARLAGEAIGAATRPDEKKAALALLARAPCPESLAIVEAAAADDSIAAEARLAAAAIRKAMAAEKR
jgi:hypothetical protein